MDIVTRAQHGTTETKQLRIRLAKSKDIFPSGSHFRCHWGQRLDKGFPPFCYMAQILSSAGLEVLPMLGFKNAPLLL